MPSKSTYFNNLIKTVIENSEANDWNTAVNEWKLDDYKEDIFLSESCICGHPNLKYLFTIRNTINNNILFPIGSECIKKFGRDELFEEASIKEQLFKLLHAIENNEHLELSSLFFSRKLLKHLYDLGAFKPTSFNNYEPYNDYTFMLNMFNKRQRTEKQEKRAIAIILNSIKPYLQTMLKDKIKK